MLREKGVNPEDATQAAPWGQTDFLLSVDDIGAAFWKTEAGVGMRDQLDNHPFDKCAP